MARRLARAALRLSLAVLLAAGTAGLVGPAAADDDAEEATQLLEAGKILPLEEIVRRAQAVRPGRILEAELEDAHGRRLYQLELLDEQGVVHELTFDAATGRLLSDGEDD